MPSVYDLKPKFQNLLRPIVVKLAAGGVTANQVTLLACALSIAAGSAVLFWFEHRAVFLLYPICLFVRMALNAIDGMLAREFGMKSKLGAILNELSDAISDIALYLPFMFVYAPGGALLFVFVLLFSVVSEYAGVLGVMIGASRRYDGPFGKSDRAFAFSVLALLLAFGVAPGRWISYAYAVMLFLVMLTIYKRAKNALREAR